MAPGICCSCNTSKYETICIELEDFFGTEIIYHDYD